MKSRTLNYILAFLVFALFIFITYLIITRPSTKRAVVEQVQSTEVGGGPRTSSDAGGLSVEDSDESQTLVDWKSRVLKEFGALALWDTAAEQSDWNLASLDRGFLSIYGKGKVYGLIKTFNLVSEPDYKGYEALLSKVKSELAVGAWSLVQGQTEGGFYQDYLYEKDGYPLVLEVGSRDAVKGVFT